MVNKPLEELSFNLKRAVSNSQTLSCNRAEHLSYSLKKNPKPTNETNKQKNQPKTSQPYKNPHK